MDKTETQEVGFVTVVQGGVVFLDGLPTAQVGELVEAENGAMGYIGGLAEDQVEVYLLSSEVVEPGQMFKRTGRYLELGLGDFVLGRVMDPMGRPLDGKVFPARMSGQGIEILRIDQPAIGVAGRRFISEQFDTGIGVIDTLFPLGKGQRELVLGESRSGKSNFLLDVVANQKGKGVVCIVGLVGKPMTEAWDFWSRLNKAGLMEHTVIVASTSVDPPPMVYLTPMAVMTVASYFQRKGKDVLVFLDDMGTHARSYREMSLVSGRPPGRESYPGDIFYQQAKVMERAGCFTPEVGGGSVTLLPVMELALSDFAAFIPTNLMGMTDGHLLFKSALAQQGQRPAIDLFLSVTRVGGQTQNRLQNLLSMRIKQTLTSANDLDVISRFGSDLPYETKLALAQREQILELLNQSEMTALSREVQVLLLSLPFTTFLKNKDRLFVKNNVAKIVAGFESDEVLVRAKERVFDNQSLVDLFAFVEGLVPRLHSVVPTGPVPTGLTTGAGGSDVRS